MKIIVFLCMLLPLIGKCQCPRWVGAQMDSISSFIHLIESKLAMDTLTKEMVHPDFIACTNEQNKATIEVTSQTFRHFDGYAGSNPVSYVESIRIVGIGTRIDSAYALLDNMVKSCPLYQSGSSWIKFDKCMIVSRPEKVLTDGTFVRSLFISKEIW